MKNRIKSKSYSTIARWLKAVPDHTCSEESTSFVGWVILVRALRKALLEHGKF